jgi:dTDP-4-dehydrorhamnose 3,5-epimerase-like enzyme
MYELSAEQPKSILVPAGCVNGHLCLSEKCLFFYKWSKKYNGIQKQVTIDYLDKKFNFNWALKDVIVSERDQNHSISSEGIFL